jgi:asparagine synthase (glutamine-hydrolysing)
MCGISVLVTSQSKVCDLHSEIQRMNDSIVHRGPDSHGIFVHNNVGLGHRRLSIIDLSEKASQPMTKAQVTISFNGEIYNYLELQKELGNLGYKFTSQSDTEVILYSYLEWGLDCFNKFNGMWAIALLDSDIDKIFLCRDNFGIKPIFYGYNKDYFFAGSESKQFLHLHGERNLNLSQCVNYINSGLLNYNENTFIEGIFELKPGHYIEIDTKTLNFAKVKWYIPKNNHVLDNYSESKNKIKQLLENSVGIRLRSDVKVGACLSGGIDSSSIVSIISETNQVSIKDFTTFTSYYDELDANELEFSNEVVSAFNLSNIKIKPNLENVIENGLVDRIIFHHEQPFSSMSNYSQLEVYSETRQNNIKVLIDGQGADEFFQGYNIFRFEYLKSSLFSLKLIQLRNFISGYALNNRISFMKSLKTLIFDPLIFIPLLKILKRQNNITLFSKDMNLILEKRNKYWDMKSLVQDQMFRSNLPALLHSADRNSMMFSIETRLPFLDYELYEYVSHIPVNFLYKDGYSKNILRDAVDSLPIKIKKRVDKMGFEAPTRLFVINNSSYIRQQIIEILNKCPFINSEVLIKYDSFINGDLEYDEVFFRLFTLNRYLSVFNIEVNKIF